MRPMVVVFAALASVAACKDSSNTAPDAGRLPDAPPAPDAPDAPPPTYQVGGRVWNLLGTGLVLALDGGSTLTINADGTFVFPEMLLSGATYTVSIQSGPANPAQDCTITHETGTIGTADVTDVEVVCPVGNLRINEISSCFFADVGCWFEVVNVGTDTEQLADYDLRGTAVDPAGGPVATTQFDLPALAIAPGGYAVVRGRAHAGFTDGQNLVHVGGPGSQRVPFWAGGGFLELLKANKTVDFVRMGTNAVMPTTIGWTGAGAPEIMATNVYGAVIARSAASADTNVAADWSRRGFATPGGPNDITSDVDLDSDGIPDQAEVSGGTFAGLDLYARGVRTGQRDVLIEVDYMPHATDPGVTPRRGALDHMVAAFATRGIAIHFDVGSLFSATPGAANHNFGGGNLVPFAPTVSITVGAAVPYLYSFKTQHMDVRLQAVSHYMVFAYELDVPSQGIAEVGGNDIFIALGNIGLTTATPVDARVTDYVQSSTMMHELGHNLGLSHGGNDNKNYKPNYVSVMNYLYGTLGIPVIGNAEGDRYYYFFRGPGSCSLISSESQLQNSRLSMTFVVDFSDGTSAPLNETAIVESAGLGRPASVPVDYNCDGSIGTVALDVDRNGSATDVHTDHDDWGAIRLPFARAAAGAAFVFHPRLSLFTDERRPVADETGFHPRAALR